MNIREYLQSHTLLFDGAMGTYIAKKHPEFGEASCELLNIEHPEWVGQVHREYLEAGAVALKTNTFAANTFFLEMAVEDIRQIIISGWEIAQKEIQAYEETHAGSRHYLFADIGPVWVPEDGDGLAIYQEIVDLFLACGAKHFLFETLADAEYIEAVTSYIKEKEKDAFIIVSFGVAPEGFTKNGCYGKSLYEQMQKLTGVDAVGFNCISGPKHLAEMVQRMDIHHSTKYVSVMPNAGYPTVISNRMYYQQDPEYFAKIMGDVAKAGAAILGGCCGTQPSHIRAMQKVLEKVQPSGHLVAEVVQVEKPDAKEQKKGTYAARHNAKNDLAAKLLQGEKVIVVELDPPMTPDVNTFMEGAARYKYAGVDAIDIADCPIARARIDSSILACKLHRELNMTAIPHMTCRDRNINATKALLLGLNVEGVNNVLTVTGDPVPAEQRQEVKTVFSYNSAVLAKHINTLNDTTFTENPFMVSGALNINAVNFDSQIRHAQKKIENGVSVLFTQPVMTKEGLENLKRARRELPVKILGGLIPVVSYRNACFMEHEIAGIRVDERIMEMYRDKNREEGEELAVHIVTAIADEMKEYIDGFYLITPFSRIGLMERIIRRIRDMK